MVNLILENFSYGTPEELTRMQYIRHNVSYVGPSGNVRAALEYQMINLNKHLIFNVLNGTNQLRSKLSFVVFCFELR